MQIIPQPKTALEGLRNQVANIGLTAQAGNNREVILLPEALYDDLNNSRVRFQWSSSSHKRKSEKSIRRGVAEYMQTQDGS